MINCIIVDDEPLARQLIASYIDQLSYVNCIAVCQSAIEAFGVLHQHKIDVIFLDIEMPGITGINFLKSLKTVPKVIFTTAYPNYAVDAFEIEAVDYLLKPITFERFIKAVQKLSFNGENTTSNKPANDPNAHLFLKVDRRLIKIDFSEIVYIEAYGDYLKVHTIKQTYITYMTLNKLEQLLPNLRFIRIHRSTIINKTCIQFIEGNFVRINDINLSIGLTYRESLLENLGNI
jgi:DNA-binding LytR/AlgR family response regulator